MENKRLIGWAAFLLAGMAALLSALLFFPSGFPIDLFKGVCIALGLAVVAVAGGIAAWRSWPGKLAVAAGLLVVALWVAIVISVIFILRQLVRTG